MTTDKTAVLRATRCLHRHPEAVQHPGFVNGAFFDPRDLVQVKYEMVRRARVDGEAVSRCATTFGLSRPSFYEADAALAAGGLAALLPRRPGPRGPSKLTGDVVAFARECVTGDPTLSLVVVAGLIRDAFDVDIGIRTLGRALTSSTFSTS